MGNAIPAGVTSTGQLRLRSLLQTKIYYLTCSCLWIDTLPLFLHFNPQLPFSLPQSTILCIHLCTPPPPLLPTSSSTPPCSSSSFPTLHLSSSPFLFCRPSLFRPGSFGLPSHTGPLPVLPPHTPPPRNAGHLGNRRRDHIQPKSNQIRGSLYI